MLRASDPLAENISSTPRTHPLGSNDRLQLQFQGTQRRFLASKGIKRLHSA